MEGERHVVIEKPDGSMAIAFNQEIPPPPPPPPPPEIIRQRPRFRFSIEYHPVIRGLAYIFVISSGINLALFRRLIDIINFVLIVSTTGALHTEHSASIIAVVLHGTCAGLMVVPLCVLRMWEQAIFQFSVGVMCLAAFNTANQIAEEIPNL
tara:strand:- start:1289 stop:1744 length:456 start_codon:yes stop_codon:yes gene_type:complete